MSLPVADAARLRRRGFGLEYATLTWMVAKAAVAITAGLITASTRHSGRAGLVGGDVEAPAWRSIWVAIGQARMGLAARDAGTSFSYLVASLSRAAGRATLHMTMQVNGGGGQTGSAVQTRPGLDLLAARDLCAGLRANMPRGDRVPGGWR